MKYLEGRYLHDLKVTDEGHYWETGNEKLLEQTFKKYTELIESFESSIEIYPFNPGESYEAYFKRLMMYLQSKKKE